MNDSPLDRLPSQLMTIIMDVSVGNWARNCPRKSLLLLCRYITNTTTHQNRERIPSIRRVDTDVTFGWINRTVDVGGTRFLGHTRSYHDSHLSSRHRLPTTSLHIRRIRISEVDKVVMCVQVDATWSLWKQGHLLTA